MWFTTAAAGFLQVTDRIGRDALGNPGLGVWDVRSLLGHTTRAFLTTESYVRPGVAGSVELATPADYYRSVRAKVTDPGQVAERGRQAGQALGDDPTSAVHGIAGRVLPLVEATPDDCLVDTPFGTMTLDGYLPTRAFELTVHGIDLARATGQDVPEALRAATLPALELGVAIASPDQRVALLLASTGRGALPGGFTVL